jgi:hypothetical protein
MNVKLHSLTTEFKTAKLLVTSVTDEVLIVRITDELRAQHGRKSQRKLLPYI